MNGTALLLPYLWIPLVLLMFTAAAFPRWRITLFAASPLLIWALFMSSPNMYLALAESCSTDAPPLRVATANVLLTNENLDSLAQDVLSQAPDVVVFQELGRDLEAVSPALAEAYRYRFSTELPWVTIASRLPLEDTRRLRVDGEDRARDPLLATVRLGGQPISVLAAHLTPPRNAGAFDEHKDQYDLLVDAAQRIAAPLIAVGDFNATALSPVFGAFLRDTGLRIAAGDQTMESTYYPVWRFGIRIDHVLVRDLDVCGEQVFDLTGSDHRGVVAEVSLPATSPD